jgi:hypothetical protein
MRRELRRRGAEEDAAVSTIMRMSLPILAGALLIAASI